MAIREFRCSNGHTTEKILFGDADKTTLSIKCPMVEHAPEGEEIRCTRRANRIDISRTAPPAFVEGVGGFYKSTNAKPTTHSTSGAEQHIKQIQSEAPGKRLSNILE